MPLIDRTGNFRLRVKDVKIRDTDKSQAVAIGFDFEVESQWDPSTKTWGQQWPEGNTVPGDVWIVAKDGGPNEANVKRLVECLGWDGDFDNIHEMVDRVCSGTVDAEEYNGKTRYRVEWVNSYQSTPGGKAASSESVAKIKSTVGERVRAIASMAQYIQPPVPPKPGAPAASSPSPAKAPSGPPKSAGTPPATSSPLDAARDAGVKDEGTAWAYVAKAKGSEGAATQPWLDAINQFQADQAKAGLTVADQTEFTADNWLVIAANAAAKK